MKKTEVEYEVYDMGDGYFVEITKSGNMLKSWIGHDECGIKMYIFGMDDVSKDEFIELVMHNYEWNKNVFDDEYNY